MTVETTTLTIEVPERRPFILLNQIKIEFLKLIRSPGFIFFTIVMPIMLFIMFGLTNADAILANGASAGAPFLFSYGTYAALSVALLSFSSVIANERGLGWYKLIRVSPMPPLATLVAKMLNTLLLGTLSITALFATGILIGGIELSGSMVVKLILLLVLGMIPFAALGLFIGYIASPNTAGVISNMIYFPMAFASGLFVPVMFLPEAVQKIAPYLPAYHVGQLGWITVGVSDGSLSTSVLWLIGYTVLFTGLALFAYRLDQRRSYG